MRELASFDLHFLMREFKHLEGSKVDKIFQKGEKMQLQLHLPNQGKKYLTITPNALFASEQKIEAVEENLAISLRKHLTNCRLREIGQVGSERIVKITFEGKDRLYFLFIELFRPGNIILCSEELKIVMAKTYKGFGNRLIRPGIEYKHPEKMNFLDVEKEPLAELLAKSKKDHIVTALAVDLGLGGIYAEEACLLSGVDKNAKTADSEKVIIALDMLKNHPIEPLILSNEPYPFKLNFLGREDIVVVKTDSFSQAIQDCQLVEDPLAKDREKISRIIKSQEEKLQELEESAKINQAIGEAIYGNYQLVNEIINASKKNKADARILKKDGRDISIEIG